MQSVWLFARCAIRWCITTPLLFEPRAVEIYSNHCMAKTPVEMHSRRYRKGRAETRSSDFCATTAKSILRVQQWSLGDPASEHVQDHVSGTKFRLTFGVHEELSARALSLNASVTQRHGSNLLCHIAASMSEEAPQFTALVERGVDVTGDSAPGTMSRDLCLHCAFESRCQSGTGARGASIRHSVSDVAERRSDAVEANPRLWVLGSGSIFHEHQTCIGLYLTTCLVHFPGATSPHAALDIVLTNAVA